MQTTHIFGVPHHINKSFVGRDYELKRLEEVLANKDAGAGAVMILCGIGGVGKTQLAVEHAYRAWNKGSYSSVFWLTMDNPDNINIQVAKLAGPMGLSDPTQVETNVDLVKRAWREALDPFLLVLDNCADPALLTEWKPTIGRCRVLVTTRNRVWPDDLDINLLFLDRLDRIASQTLLLTPRAQRHGQEPTDLLLDNANAEEADAICQLLDYLPLALALAGAYLKIHVSMSLARYREQLAADLIRHRSLHNMANVNLLTGHEASVAVTFTSSYGYLDARNDVDEHALRLLQRAACCGPGAPIPRRLALRAAAFNPDNPRDEDQADEALNRLTTLGLITEEHDHALTLHRLVASYVRDRSPDLEIDRAEVEEALLVEVAALTAQRNPLPGAPYIEHLRHMVQMGETRTDAIMAALMNELALLLYYGGDHTAARPLFERTLVIREQILGPNNLETAQSLTDLARLLADQGEYEAALPRFERAFTINEQVRGPNHLETARSLVNLAELLAAQGDYARARPLYERALAIYKQVSGAGPLEAARIVNSLAGLLAAQGNDTEARPLYERTLHIYIQELGPDHPDTQEVRESVESLLSALSYHEQAPNLKRLQAAQNLTNLAGLLCSRGDYATARILYEHALDNYEQVRGPSHWETAQSLTNLAKLLAAQGDYAAAHLFYERALPIFEWELGLDHPTTREVTEVLESLSRRELETAQSLISLAKLLVVQEDHKTARILYDPALSVYARELGLDHPATQEIKEAIESLPS